MPQDHGTIRYLALHIEMLQQSVAHESVAECIVAAAAYADIFAMEKVATEELSSICAVSSQHYFCMNNL